MHLPNHLLVRFSVLALAIVGAAPTHATSLVNGFNVVTLGNFSSQNSDLQGTLAVGVDATLSSFILNQSATNPNTAANGFDTVVGGTLSLNSGSIYGKAFAGAANITNANVCSGCLVTGGASPVDFAALGSQVRAENTFLYSLSPTGSVTMPYSTLLLNGAGSSPLQVFSITSSQLSNNSGIDISGVGSHTTVLINVSDSGSHAATTSSGGLAINQQQVETATNVIFNFAESISNISIANSVYSSIFAPGATVSGTYGAFNGDLVASAYSGSNQFNLDPFTGELPSTPTPAPEPGTLGLFSGLTAAVLAYSWMTSRRRCSSRIASFIGK